MRGLARASSILSKLILVAGCAGDPVASVPVEITDPGRGATPSHVAEPAVAVAASVEAEPVASAPADPAAPEPAPAPAPDPAPGHADRDPDNDTVVGPPEPLEDCDARLLEAGVKWKPARIGVGRKQGGVYTCGAHQVVRYRSGPEKIAYSTSPLLTCTMALALVELERIVQEEAERELGKRVTKIEHLGTYNCREMANYDLVSEHSFANAIDLRRFRLQGGDTVDVLEHFVPGEDPAPHAKARFLRKLANRLYDEDVFSVVVTPYFDALHRNHLHVDLARYRVDGSRP